MMLEVPCRVLPHGEGLVPRYASAGAAGLDLCAAIAPDTALELAPWTRAVVPTGIALALPEGTEGQLRPRSGLAAKHGVSVLNAPGTIDEDFRGEIMAILINLSSDPFALRRGERIAQLVVAPVARVRLSLVATFDVTARGAGGFGSTGV